jgi:hypothetical protein
MDRARRRPQRKAEERPQGQWTVRLLGALFLLSETVVVPIAFSSFRLPKEVLALTGLALAFAIFYGVRVARGWLTLPGLVVGILRGWKLIIVAKKFHTLLSIGSLMKDEGDTERVGHFDSNNPRCERQPLTASPGSETNVPAVCRE